jgi:hypothetical protein
MIKWRYNVEKKECIHNSMIKLWNNEEKKERKNEWKMDRMNAWMTNNDWIITMNKWQYNEEKKECMHNWMIKL